MAAWIGITSAHIDGVEGVGWCGEDTNGNILPAALDATAYWKHTSTEIHWFILDLGQTYTITKVRGRSIKVRDPIAVDIFVSDNKGAWGAAVASGIATWQDTAVWQEVNTTEKNGRYIKVVINGTETGTPGTLEFGQQGGGINIFDAYGEAVAVAAGVGAAAELLATGQI